MPTKFQVLAELGEELEKTTKRIVMIDLVAKVLAKLDSIEIKPATAMIIGQPFSERDNKTLDVSWSTISSAIKKLVKVEWKTIEETFGETGDLGSTVKSVFERNEINRQSTLLQKPLTILEVKNF
jgi:DNA-binding transcriptional ArsR family regulator